MSGWRLLALGVWGLAAACQRSHDANYVPRLVTRECTGVDALEGVHYIRWRLTGPGMEPVERYVPAGDAVVQAPVAPVGPGRLLEVRGYTDLPSAGGQVVSRGLSRPFEVSDTSRIDVPIALRRVGVYSMPSSSTGDCLMLTQTRAGHTATLLADGRVLLAGGYQLDTNGAPFTLTSTEIFDPLSTVVAGPELGERRAFHTATRLPGGRVILAGGEDYSTSLSSISQSAEVLDVEQGLTTQVALRTARSHHAAAADAQGRVLWVGGEDAIGYAVDLAEGYDPSTGQTFPVATPVVRKGLSALAVEEGRRIAVVGGSNGTQLQSEVLFFAYDGHSFVPSGEAASLTEPRRDGALVAFGGAERLLYVGGLASSTDTKDDTHFLASSQVLFPADPARGEAGPVIFPRSRPCAVALPDGRVMTLGGVEAVFGERHSDAHVELLIPAKEGGAPGLLGVKPLGTSRSQHTCTVLEDGSVLVVGGLTEEGDHMTTLGDLLLYTPVPMD